MSDEQKNQDEALQNENQQADASIETGEAEEAAATDQPDVEAQLAAAQQEIADLKEQVLRVQAEMQNVRRRAELDVEKAHKFGLEKFANEMVTVVDNLERGLAAAPEEEATKAIRDGIEMTLNGFLSALAKFNVDVVDPVGHPFDPEHHQAMTMVESADAEPNSVVAVMQKGYLMNGRLLRPAMVVVSKGSSAS
ncbi:MULTISPECIES: nucleotide exchange factor GrpE [unclassified Oceanobacter]|jgi:molecular chaperone GrpE|uniref:nucleotide exchange factor GrpE n=1 Tax=unclassified Oceanobacter TaxID=2620260 RepID=UPI0026E168B1|nr:MULTISPECIES: nucleotide exchange factor GrpE [unclassified Oceanobacter]MDO6681375.1 nucleotide exchange factor GrpE [Oceanobacter sp. 5_MG-2023]MDP2505084.1 nucleotide exchange factor GrpE [Oceanobacter sp. 3_MG-2023]MDP2548208.1 nucleotide exchange factor GrpE [Oceanobacter sp. 4_MG-2023]